MLTNTMMKNIRSLIIVGSLICSTFLHDDALAFTPQKHYHPSHRDSPLRASTDATTTNKHTVQQHYDVAIFGGGFGGLYTALALQRSNPSLHIALVEPTDRFVFLPLLYDLTVGTATEAEVCPSYSSLLRGTGIRHVRARLVGMFSTEGVAEIQCMAENDDDDDGSRTKICYKAGVMAVGASPESILQSVEGARDYAQPFYTADDARATRQLLEDLEKTKARIAVVGGGFGGVELAASVQRRLYDANVTLLSRGAPMAGTRAERLVDQALRRLGVSVEDVSVDALRLCDTTGKIVVDRSQYGANVLAESDDEPWDAVLWTAGSSPSLPDACEGLKRTSSGRLEVDDTLRVQMHPDAEENSCCLFAVGDCAEQPGTGIPKTASTAIQQAPIVVANIQTVLGGKKEPLAKFTYNELGSLLTLGGPNAAAIAPMNGVLAPFVTAGLDVVDRVLNTADQVLQKSPVGTKPDILGLSVGSYGVGVEERASGTIAGTVTGGKCTLQWRSWVLRYTGALLSIFPHRYPSHCLCCIHANQFATSCLARLCCALYRSMFVARSYRRRSAKYYCYKKQ